MTTVLMFVVGIAIIAGVVWLMMRMERATVNGKTVSMVHRFSRALSNHRAVGISFQIQVLSV